MTGEIPQKLPINSLQQLGPTEQSEQQGELEHSLPIVSEPPKDSFKEAKGELKEWATDKLGGFALFTGLFFIPGVISGLKSGFTIAAKNITSGTAKGVAAGIFRDLTVGLLYQTVIVGPSLSAGFLAKFSTWSQTKEKHQKEINARVFKKSPANEDKLPPSTKV